MKKYIYVKMKWLAWMSLLWVEYSPFLEVWHTVSVSAQKRGEARKGCELTPAITLLAGEARERFATQPPVRPSVIFGSDPAHEVEVGTALKLWCNRTCRLRTLLKVDTLFNNLVLTGDVCSICWYSRRVHSYGIHFVVIGKDKMH